MFSDRSEVLTPLRRTRTERAYECLNQLFSREANFIATRIHLRAAIRHTLNILQESINLRRSLQHVSCDGVVPILFWVPTFYLLLEPLNSSNRIPHSMPNTGNTSLAHRYTRKLRTSFTQRHIRLDCSLYAAYILLSSQQSPCS